MKTDVIVIGAGLLGCFTARNLMRHEIDVIVLEKESDVCRGISKANTGIIYSGYDSSPGSEKQKLCVQASEDFDRLCSELEVPFRRPGSLMVAYGPRADAVIKRKYDEKWQEYTARFNEIWDNFSKEEEEIYTKYPYARGQDHPASDELYALRRQFNEDIKNLQSEYAYLFEEHKRE